MLPLRTGILGVPKRTYFFVTRQCKYKTTFEDFFYGTKEHFFRPPDTVFTCSKLLFCLQAFTQTYSRAVPTEEALALIAAQTKGGRVLELYAETGIWSYLLSALYDVDILPTDEKPSVILQYGRVWNAILWIKAWHCSFILCLLNGE